jgi:hypothetical protein
LGNGGVGRAPAPCDPVQHSGEGFERSEIHINDSHRFFDEGDFSRVVESAAVLSPTVMHYQPATGGERVMSAHQCFGHLQEGDFRDEHIERLAAFVADDLVVFPRDRAPAAIPAVFDDEMIDELKAALGLGFRVPTLWRDGGSDCTRSGSHSSQANHGSAGNAHRFDFILSDGRGKVSNLHRFCPFAEVTAVTPLITLVARISKPILRYSMRKNRDKPDR